MSATIARVTQAPGSVNQPGARQATAGIEGIPKSTERRDIKGQYDRAAMIRPLLSDHTLRRDIVDRMRGRPLLLTEVWDWFW